MNIIKSILLNGNGTHIDLVCSPPWNTKRNVAISSLQLFEREELAKMLKDNGNLMASLNLFPFKVDDTLYTVSIKGESTSDPTLLKAIFNG